MRKDFSNFNLNDILFNWEACMGCGPSKVRRSVPGYPPPGGVLKFNVDGASRGDSNEVEVLAISEALRLFSRYCNEALIV